MRPRLVLVRHARPAPASGAEPDPGLAPEGVAQAMAMAAALDVDGGPRPVLVSPLRRTRDTAAALEARWGAPPTVEPAVGEIPSPSHDPARRLPWLRATLAARLLEIEDELRRWRGALVARLLEIERDAVVVTHYVPINVAVGVAVGDDRVVCFAPDHCSRTGLEVDGGRLRVATLGAQSRTTVR